MAEIKINELGRIVMYALSTSLHIPFSTFSNAAQQNGVPLNLLPSAMSPIGAWKRACTQIREDTKALAEPITVKEIDIPDDSDIIMRTFEKRIASTEEDVNAMKQGDKYKPVYKPLVTIQYNRKTLNMTFSSYEDDNGSTSEGDEVFAKVLEEYNRLCGNMNIQQVRQTIQNALRLYGSVKFKTRGNNFVPYQNEADWKRFSNFVSSFDGVEITEFIVGNNPENVETLQRSLMSDITNSVEEEVKKLGKPKGNQSLAELITEFGTALAEKQKSKKALGNSALATMLNRYQTTMEKVSLYKELLEADLSVVDSQIAIAQSQIVSLMTGEDAA